MTARELFARFWFSFYSKKKTVRLTLDVKQNRFCDECGRAFRRLLISLIGGEEMGILQGLYGAAYIVV